MEQARSWAHALQLLHNMTLDAVSPDDVAFNSAAIACGSAHVWEGALSVLRGMELSRVPSDETYFETMTALVLKGHYATAVQLFRQWEASAGVRYRVSDTLFDLRGMRVEVSAIAVRVAVLDTMGGVGGRRNSGEKSGIYHGARRSQPERSTVATRCTEPLEERTSDGGSTCRRQRGSHGSGCSNCFKTCSAFLSTLNHQTVFQHR